MKLKPIREQVVVVMGASSGIGRATALAAAKKGARVVISARSTEGLNTLAAQIRQDGGQVLSVPADVSDFTQVKNVADRAMAEYGQLDTWAHVAGVSLFARFDQTDPAEFRRVVEVNLLGQAYGAMAALPHLKRSGGGALIHISSVLSRRGVPLQSAYSASKHGIKGLVEALRTEIEHDHLPISVTEILPASINTQFFNKARTKLGVMPKGFPPYYQPEVVVQAILYAAEHPAREIIVGGAGKMLIQSEQLSPRLVDRLSAWLGFRVQQTDRLKGESAPNALFEPVDVYNWVEGEFGAHSFQSSAYTQLQTRPALRWGLLSGLAAMSLATLALRARSGR